MTIILMIRHGENDFLGKRLAGRLPGVHLNEAGKQQARDLVPLLAAAPVQAIYSSPMERARETAQPLAEARGLEIQIVEGLNEINYGEWDGKTFEELRQFELWHKLRENPGDVRFPGGESFQEAQQRVGEVLEKITKFVRKNGTAWPVSPTPTSFVSLPQPLKIVPERIYAPGGGYGLRDGH